MIRLLNVDNLIELRDYLPVFLAGRNCLTVTPGCNEALLTNFLVCIVDVVPQKALGHNLRIGVGLVHISILSLLLERFLALYLLYRVIALVLLFNCLRLDWALLSSRLSFLTRRYLLF